MTKKPQRESADIGLVILGLIAWVAAIIFGAAQATVEVDQVTDAVHNTKIVRAPNIASAGAACGFAIAGGMCFIGAALATRGSRSETTENADLSEIPDTKH